MFKHLTDIPKIVVIFMSLLLILRFAFANTIVMFHDWLFVPKRGVVGLYSVDMASPKLVYDNMLFRLGYHNKTSVPYLAHLALLMYLFRSIHFLSKKLFHLPKNTRSCVENECCYPRTDNISNDFKNIYTTRTSIQQHGTANVWPW